MFSKLTGYCKNYTNPPEEFRYTYKELDNLCTCHILIIFLKVPFLHKHNTSPQIWCQLHRILLNKNFGNELIQYISNLFLLFCININTQLGLQPSFISFGTKPNHQVPVKELHCFSLFKSIFPKLPQSLSAIFKASSRVNLFLVLLSMHSVIFFCWMNNGNFYTLLITHIR